MNNEIILNSIKEEIETTEEMLEENYKKYHNGEMNYAGYEYFRNKIIQDTYEMIKQILEKEGK